MKKSTKITLVIIAVLTVVTAALYFVIIRPVLGFFGYHTPLDRLRCRLKTDAALERKYPEHDFEVETENHWGDYGFYLSIDAEDENGIGFEAQWIKDELDDQYHQEWNEYYYGKKIVEYQNDLRDQYFPQIPYVDTYEYDPEDSYDFRRGPFKEVFFESMEDAVEGSKCGSFNTDVTFKGIDLNTADDEEVSAFAGSMADSLIRLYEETGYYNISINSFYYRGYDESGADVQTRDELIEAIIKNVEFDRER